MAKKRISNDEMAETPISSMIDVVFLLIIFFVVTAAIDKDVEDEKVILAEAPHGKPVTKKDPRTVVINVHQDGVMTMGMREVKQQEITKALEEMKVKEAEAGRGLDFPILIRADYNAQHGYVKQAMEAVTNTGLYSVKINAMLSE